MPNFFAEKKKKNLRKSKFLLSIINFSPLPSEGNYMFAAPEVPLSATRREMCCRLTDLKIFGDFFPTCLAQAYKLLWKRQYELFLKLISFGFTFSKL